MKGIKKEGGKVVLMEEQKQLQGSRLDSSLARCKCFKDRREGNGVEAEDAGRVHSRGKRLEGGIWSPPRSGSCLTEDMGKKNEERPTEKDNNW